MNQKAYRKKWAEIIAKAWIDPKFKARLLEHPREVMSEMGIILPHNAQPKIVENTADHFYLVLPEKPEGHLSEAELRKVAAATTSTDNPAGMSKHG